jgi:hypothetical protein
LKPLKVESCLKVVSHGFESEKYNGPSGETNPRKRLSHPVRRPARRGLAESRKKMCPRPLASDALKTTRASRAAAHFSTLGACRELAYATGVSGRSRRLHSRGPLSSSRAIRMRLELLMPPADEERAAIFKCSHLIFGDALGRHQTRTRGLRENGNLRVTHRGR